MFDGRWRAGAERVLAPVGSGLHRTGLAADHLTLLGLGLAAAAGAAVATGHLLWGAILLVASALPDVLDGAVAKAGGTASPRGAFFDSVADRVADAAVLTGVAWHLSSGRHPHRAVLAVGVIVVSMLVSYERAKAESLGLSARGGLMERAERIALLTVGLVFGSVLVPVLWALLGLTGLTVLQRFVRVWRQASVPRPAARWRSWRPVGFVAARHDGGQAWRAGAWRARRAPRPRSRTWRRGVHTRP